MTFINVKFCTHAQCLLLLSYILQYSHVSLCPVHVLYCTLTGTEVTMLRMAILKVKFVAPVNMTTHTASGTQKYIH